MSAVEQKPVEQAKKPEEIDDTKLLAEINQRAAYALSKWANIRKEGDLNMRALSITGPWPQEEIDARSKGENKRPCGHTDIISQYTNRVSNQWRMNPRGVKVDQTGEGATDKTAELRESRIREIAYHSQAKAARMCALQNMTERGYGCWEVYADYESPKTFKQKPCIGAIQNPNSVLVDPDTSKPDRSDMKYAVKLGKTMSEEEFKRKYRNARDLASFPADLLGMAKLFTDGKTVTPAEYYRVVSESRTLLALDDGRELFKEDLGDGFTVKGKQVLDSSGAPVAGIVRERESELPRVEKYITNGLEILKREKLPISTIPIIFGVAREKYENDVLVVEALTSKMREPQLNYDVVTAAKIEAVNQIPKVKLLISDEAIAGYEDQYKNAHRDPQFALMYHAVNRDGKPMPPPQEISFSPDIGAFEVAGNTFLRDVQNAVGMTSAERVDRVAKSGIAQQELNASADIASYHIVDNMLMAVEYEGRVLNEWLSIIEDSERTVGLRKPDGKYVTEHIVPTENDGKVNHPYGKADSHAVTIGTGPDYASQRDEKVEFIKDIIKNPDFVANPVAPLLVHEMEMGPGGDKIEKILLSVQPPAVQKAYQEGEEGAEPIAPEVAEAQAELDKAKQIIQAVTQQLEQAQQTLDQKQIEAEAKAQIEAAKIAADKEIEAEKLRLEYAKLELEREKLALDRFKVETDFEKAKLSAQVSLQTKHDDLSHKEGLTEFNAQHSEHMSDKEAARKEAGEIG